MNTVSFLARRIMLYLSLTVLVVLARPDANAAIVTGTAPSNYGKVSEEALRERISNINASVDLRLSAESNRMIKNYIVRYRHDSQKLLARAGLYFHIFEQAIREKNLPQELKYLAIVESALNPKARSKAGAVGLWQFVSATAGMYDMEINQVVDERRDPNISTAAALDYLSDLEAQFGDWTLALAAYNCGPGNMRKAIRKAGSKDYWKIQPYLPKETQNYIPRFVAAAYLMSYYHMHDLQPANLSEDLALTNTTMISEQLRFDELGKMLNMDMKTIETLNPAFLKRIIPVNDGRYLLRLPESKMYDFLINKDQIMGYFQIEDGDDRHSEFRRIQELIPVNTETQIKILSTPQTGPIYNEYNIFERLKIVEENESSPELDPRDAGIPKSVNPSNDHGIIEETTRKKRKNQKRYEYYKISNGETIFDIVNKRKDLSIEEIYKINDFQNGQSPKSGMIVRLKELK